MCVCVCVWLSIMLWKRRLNFIVCHVPKQLHSRVLATNKVGPTDTPTPVIGGVGATLGQDYGNGNGIILILTRTQIHLQVVLFFYFSFFAAFCQNWFFYCNFSMRLAFTFTLTLARFVSDSILSSFACYCARYSYAACDAQRKSTKSSSCLHFSTHFT